MNKIKNILWNNIDICGSVVIAIIAYVLIFDVASIVPSNVNFIMAGGDLAQNYLGGVIYRSESWSWDIFKINSITFPYGITLLGTDGNPLMSFLMKVMQLPAYYQFFGIWHLLCFILSGIASVLIFRHIFQNKFLILISSIFFILSPIMLWRCWAHVNLTAHWIVLFAIAIYLKNGTALLTWTGYSILLFISFLIHPYFAPMVFLLALLHMAKKGIQDKELDIKKAGEILIILLLTIGIALCLLPPIGATHRSGWEFYSMNLNAPFNSFNLSHFLKSLSHERGQYEGFNYLGLGLIVLFFMSFGQFLRDVNRKTITQNWPILLYCLIMTGFALSSKVYLNNTVILNYNFNGWLNFLGESFRSSGRMFWPVWYLLVYYIILSAQKMYKKGLYIILPVVLALQIYDLTPLYVKRNAVIANTDNKTFVQLSSDWEKIFASHPNVMLINSTENYDKFWYAIPKYKIKVNYGYLTMYDENIRRQMDRAEYLIQQGYLPAKRNTVFIISTDLYNKLKKQKRNSQQQRLFTAIKEIDGIKYLLSNPEFVYEGKQKIWPPEKILSFNSADIMMYVNLKNFSHMEEWGRWSVGKNPTMSFKLKKISEPVTVILKLHPYMNKKIRKKTVKVYVNGRKDTKWKFKYKKDFPNKFVVNILPSDIGEDGEVTIQFKTNKISSPSAVGKGDIRKLNLGFVEMKLQKNS